MHPRERLPFTPIPDRPPLRLPEGIRLVVWPVLSLEDWDLSRPMARMVISLPRNAPLVTLRGPPVLRVAVGMCQAWFHERGRSSRASLMGPGRFLERVVPFGGTSAWRGATWSVPGSNR